MGGCRAPRADDRERRTRSTALVAFDDRGLPVGAGWLSVTLQDNLHLAEVRLLSVLPGHRRQGAGRALLAELELIALAGGRQVVTSLQNEPSHLAGRSPGRLFALAHGYTNVQTKVRRNLRLPFDDARLCKLETASRRHAEGYQVLTSAGRCPEKLLEDRALLSQRMSTDAPLGDSERGEEAWDAARVREQERLVVEMGRSAYSAGAVHEATGRLVAFSDIAISNRRPERGFQWDTLVVREHRGHRLGLLVKVANLRAIAGASPPTTRLSTWNAEENGPMIAINEALGFEVVATANTWEKRLTS